MAFSTFGDVRSIAVTDMSNAQITNLITWTDARIKLKLDTTSVPNGLTAGEWNAFLEGLSATWSALRVMLRDPNASTLGEYREDRGEAIRQLWEQVKDDIRTGAGPGLQYHSEPLPNLTTDP